MSKSITRDLKETYYSMYDTDGNRRVTEVGQLGVRKIPKDRLDILECLFRYIMEGGRFSDEFKIYIKNRDWTLQRVKEYIEEKTKKADISLNIISGKVMYDKRKIESQLGNEFVYSVINERQSDVDISKKKLAKVINRHGSIKELIDINFDGSEVKNKFDGNFIEEYGELIRDISKHYRKELEQRVEKEKEFRGYLSMLLSGIPSDDEQVIKDRENVLKILHGDYTSLEEEEHIEDNKEEHIILKTEHVRVDSNKEDNNSAIKVVREHFGSAGSNKEASETSEETDEIII